MGLFQTTTPPPAPLFDDDEIELAPRACDECDGSGRCTT